MRRALALALSSVTFAAGAAQVEVIQNSGPSDQRIDLIVLGDGYTTADQAKLSDDARGVVEGLFQETPYGEYRALFNVKVIHVVSNQNGADNGTYGATRDTALGAYFNCGGIDRLLCVDSAAVTSAALADAPEYDVLVVLSNDPKYGGSGGPVAVLSTHTAGIDLLRHELSHTIAGLADEYETPYPGYPTCSTSSDCPEPNATVKNTRTTAKWASWIESSTSVPTLESVGNNAIGVYEGCRYKSAGVFRPKDENCLMKVLGSTADFCSVCREGLIWSFWRRAPVISGTVPANTAPVQVCGGATLVVQTPPKSDNAYSYLWSVDGAPTTQTGSSFIVDSAVSTGTHTISVVARDTTTMVRNDPSGVLAQQASWTVQACTAGPCDEVAQCDGSTCRTTPKAAGTSCAPASCTGGVQRGPGACDGAGGCVMATVECGAYACNDAAVACRTACSADSHCRDGKSCVENACVTRPPEVEPPEGCAGCSSSGAFGWAGFALVALSRSLRRRRRT